MISIKPGLISPDMTTDQEMADGLALKEDKNLKNQPSGYAGLDISGKIPLALLPDGLSNSEVGIIDGGSPASTYLVNPIDGGEA